MKRAVAIGGGHGLSRSLQGLKLVADEVTAIVTVADDGGSSGRLRRDLGVAPPGDLRMALAALANDDELARLLQYRFGEGELEGHSLGNLIVVALADLLGGDLVRALDRLGQALDVPGRVLPCTPTPLVLHGHRAGYPIEGQVELATGGTPDRVWIEPSDPPATPLALEAIAAADVIVLGPGSLYTSVLPNLLVPEIGAAVAASTVPVVLIANLREQLGETEGLTLADHVEALHSHLHDLRLSAVIAHAGPRPAGGGQPLDPTVLQGRPDLGLVHVTDLLDGDDGHDPARLAEAVRSVVADLGTGGGHAAGDDPARDPAS